MRKGGHAPFISFGVYSSIQKVEDIYISNALLELLLQGLFYMMAAILYMWSTVATKPQNLWPAPFRAWKGGLNWWPSRVGHAATPCMWRARDSVGISKLSANWSVDPESQTQFECRCVRAALELVWHSSCTGTGRSSWECWPWGWLPILTWLSNPSKSVIGEICWA